MQELCYRFPNHIVNQDPLAVLEDSIIDVDHEGSFKGLEGICTIALATFHENNIVGFNHRSQLISLVLVSG